MITFDDDLVQTYLAECEEHLAIMETSLVSLESGGPDIDEGLVNRLLQAAQSVKGGADLCGLAKVGELARRIERVLAPIRSERVAPTAERVTVLLHAIDALRAMLDDPGTSNAVDVSATIAALAGSSASFGTPVPRAAGWRLQTLLVEDDFTSRLLLQTFLSRYGDCHVAVNGREAVGAFGEVLENGQPYDLICMDIMMPEMNGGEAVRRIRALEEARGTLSPHGAKIIMTTAVIGIKDVMRCFRDLCDAYLVKPIDLGQLLAHMKSYDLVE